VSLINIERCREGAIEPKRGTKYSACWDLFACLDGVSEETIFTPHNCETKCIFREKDIWLDPGDRVLVPTGWKMRPGESDKCIHVYGRSGKALKLGLGLPHSVGIIDYDYSNEVFVPLVNTSESTIILKHGDAIGQMCVVDVDQLEFNVVDALPAVESDRTGGFGSTGE